VSISVLRTETAITVREESLKIPVKKNI